jgi:hypothetical protein
VGEGKKLEAACVVYRGMGIFPFHLKLSMFAMGFLVTIFINPFRLCVVHVEEL